MKYWAVIVVLLPLAGTVLGSYTANYIGTVGVTKAQHDSDIAKFEEFTQSSIRFREMVTKTTETADEINRRQDIAISNLLNAVIDLKETTKETNQDVKELLRRR